MKKSKAFTLIELIAVLVILAILALIVTPLVLNIIKKARTAADKRSIDAYGRSVELAIADYLLDKGEFPTSIDQLKVEYTGDKVECTTTQIKSDSSVYLAGCTVAGRDVTGYTYGTEEAAPTYTAYTVGDEVTYNNVDYRIIKNSSASESTVTLLKSEPLTYEEVQTYSNGTGSETRDNNGYGGMQYYSSDTCNGYGTYDGCTTDYAQSEVKYVVDAWKADKASGATEARLITLDEVINLGYEMGMINPSTEGWVPSSSTPSFVYNSNYSYWTMSPSQDSSTRGCYVHQNGVVDTSFVTNVNAVRPVITLLKSELN